jgi:hypothetical protein
MYSKSSDSLIVRGNIAYFVKFIHEKIGDYILLLYDLLQDLLFLILIMIISMLGSNSSSYKLLNLLIVGSLILTHFLFGSSNGGNFLALIQILFPPNLVMPFIFSKLISIIRNLILIFHLFCIL